MEKTLSLLLLALVFSFQTYAQSGLTRSAAKDSLAVLKNQVLSTAEELMQERMRPYFPFRRFEQFQQGKYLSQDSMMWVLGEVRTFRERTKPLVMKDPQILVLEKEIEKINRVIQWEFAETQVDKEAYEMVHFSKLATQTQTLMMYLDIYREDLRQMEAREGTSRGGLPANQEYLFGTDPNANDGMGNGIGFKLYRDCIAFSDSLISWSGPEVKETLKSSRLSPVVKGESWVKHTFSGNTGQNLKSLDALRNHILELKDTYIRGAFGWIFE